MATWQDGPEYAPLERPDEFAVPAQPPLSQAAPYGQQAGLAPKERPVFADPPVPVAPLATLIPVVEDARDPSLPFAVVSSAVTPSTTQTAWSAAHWHPPTGPPAAGGWGPPAPAAALAPAAQPAPVLDARAAPAATPGWPPPTEPFHLSREHRGASSRDHGGGAAFPAPGTPGWFAPPPTPPPVPAGPVGPVRAQDVIAGLTPAVLICLALGALIHLLSPLTLGIAALLAARSQVARTPIRAVFAVTMGLLVLIGLLLALVDAVGFDGWWSALGWTALALSWILLVVLPLIAASALRRGERLAPPGAS